MAVTTPTARPSSQQHRPLLDVRLDVGEQFARARRSARDARPDRRRSGAAPRARLTPSASRRVSQRRIEAAGHGAAADQRAAEAHAFLVAERHHFEREGQSLPASWSARTQAIAVMTPNMPSYLPALRTVSRCEPSSRPGARRRAFVAARRRCRARRAAPSCRPRASSSRMYSPARAVLRRQIAARQRAADLRVNAASSLAPAA